MPVKMGGRTTFDRAEAIVRVAVDSPPTCAFEPPNGKSCYFSDDTVEAVTASISVVRDASSPYGSESRFYYTIGFDHHVKDNGKFADDLRYVVVDEDGTTHPAPTSLVELGLVDVTNTKHGEPSQVVDWEGAIHPISGDFKGSRVIYGESEVETLRFVGHGFDPDDVVSGRLKVHPVVVKRPTHVYAGAERQPDDNQFTLSTSDPGVLSFYPWIMMPGGPSREILDAGVCWEFPTADKFNAVDTYLTWTNLYGPPPLHVSPHASAGTHVCHDPGQTNYLVGAENFGSLANRLDYVGLPRYATDFGRKTFMVYFIDEGGQTLPIDGGHFEAFWPSSGSNSPGVPIDLDGDGEVGDSMMAENIAEWSFVYQERVSAGDVLADNADGSTGSRFPSRPTCASRNWGTAPSGDAIPNWAYYWGQVVTADDGRPAHEYRFSIGELGSAYGKCLRSADAQWDCWRGNREEVLIDQGIATAYDRTYRLGGIDLFAATIRHERTHVAQSRCGDSCGAYSTVAPYCPATGCTDTGLAGAGWSQAPGLDNRVDTGTGADLDADDDAECDGAGGTCSADCAITFDGASYSVCDPEPGQSWSSTDVPLPWEAVPYQVVETVTQREFWTWDWGDPGAQHANAPGDVYENAIGD